MTKKVLVTGGAGFIGSNFVHHIKNKYPDYHVMVLDALTYAGFVENLPAEMINASNGRDSFWYGNVCNPDIVNTLVAQVDFVVHFAAETHVTKSIFDNRLFFETDVLGTHTIANAVLKYRDNVEKFIHISTSEVYGTADQEFIDENHPLNPMSPYASAKCGADRLVYSYCETYKIPAVIMRPFNNFGPRQHLEKLLPRFTTSVLLDEPMTVHGDGSAARDFVFVEDVCNAIDKVLHAANDKVVGQVFNVATGTHRTITEVADTVLKLMDGDTENIVFTADRPGQVARHTGDWSKIKQALGWQPEVDWEGGVQNTIDWFRNNREHWQNQLWLRKTLVHLPDGSSEYQ
ncbi:MAG TPA: NAD-dependent epimerase/dehydratase family protein [Rhodospirillales bacterium]|nr:NAD-dependent epimerase/dehydratase family protein [Rhodospirillales bacterium]